MDTCYYCDRPATLLCDFDIGSGKTCNRPVCELHGTKVGVSFASGKDGWADTVDYCRAHMYDRINGMRIPECLSCGAYSQSECKCQV